MSMTMAVETITPAKAREYLTKNIANSRKLSKSKAKQYADDMRSGRWELNGEPIVFDEHGILKNGQHRLAAILYSNKDIVMTVIRGVKDDVTIYDVGMQRTSVQIAKANGIDIPQQAIATAKIIINHFRTVPKGIEAEYIEKNQGELSRAYRISCLGSGKPCKKSSIVAATYLMLRTEKIRSYEAELFFKVFNSESTIGTDGYDVSPALVAKRMFNERFQYKSGSMALREQLEILVLAMEDFRNGVHREKNYKIAQPFHYEKLIEEVRNLDGIE